MELRVGNLDHNTTPEELKNIFLQYGKIVNARMIIDTYTLQRRGFGFIRMATHRQGLRAIKELHGKIINKRLLTVEQIFL